MLRVEQACPMAHGCAAPCPSSTGSWLLPVANADCSVLRTRRLPSPALHPSLCFFLPPSNVCICWTTAFFIFSLRHVKNAFCSHALFTK